MADHVLFLPSWYGTRDNPVHGSFFRDQALAASAAGCRVGVVFAELQPLSRVSARALIENRWTVSSCVEGAIPTVRTKGWRIPGAKGATDSLWIRNMVWLTKRYISAYGRPDVVHAHCAHNAGRAALAVGDELGLPFVITEHFSGYLRGMIDARRSEQARRVFGGARRVVAVSEFLADAIRPLAGSGGVEVIPNVVDTEFYTPPPAPRPDGVFRFFFLGFLTPVKRVDLLLEAFRLVTERHPDVTLGIGGDGFQRAELEHLARRLGLGERVRFHGMLTRDEVRDALWNSHAFVSSSDVETFGVSLVEAMSTGLPVIATRSGGPEEFVTPGTGRLVPTGAADALAGAMDEVVADRTAWGRRAGEIHNHVAGRFGHKVIGVSLARLYRAAVAG